MSRRLVSLPKATSSLLFVLLFLFFLNFYFVHGVNTNSTYSNSRNRRQQVSHEDINSARNKESYEYNNNQHWRSDRTNSYSDDSKNNTSSNEEEISERRRRETNRKREGALIAKNTLRAGNDERCDWRYQPLSFIRGEMCGSHYKVLGLDRDMHIDKASVKRAFRQKSLQIHPDKNSAPEADAAFKLAQAAYYCLVDDSCREAYDEKLEEEEALIRMRREELKEKVISVSLNAINQCYYHVSVAANYIYRFGVDIWDLVGEWEPDVLGVERLPVGKGIMAAFLLLKGQLFLKLHAISYVVMRINYEIAKAKGIL